jgi:hypothetical protein
MHWLGAKRARPVDNTVDTMFAGVEREAVVEALRSDGLFSGLVLPSDIHEEIADFAGRTPCFGNFDRRLEFMPGEHSEAEKRFGRSLLSGHFFERILDCPAALAIQRDPLLLDVAAHYLGGQAKLITTRVWWSFPTGAASDADKNLASLGKYHFDLDDWRMLKFFFYLKPVDADTGPPSRTRGSGGVWRAEPGDADWRGRSRLRRGPVRLPHGHRAGAHAAADDGSRLRRIAAIAPAIPWRAGHPLSLFIQPWCHAADARQGAA